MRRSNSFSTLAVRAVAGTGSLAAVLFITVSRLPYELARAWVLPRTKSARRCWRLSKIGCDPCRRAIWIRCLLG